MGWTLLAFQARAETHETRAVEQAEERAEEAARGAPAVSYQIATTVTSPILQADFEGRWARAIWYQPGATIQINDGQALPLTSRLFRFDRPARMTVVGRAAMEYGQSGTAPGPAVESRRGPAFTMTPLLFGAQPVLFIIPGLRAVRIDKVILRSWSNPTVGMFAGGGTTVAPPSIYLQRFSGTPGNVTYSNPVLTNFFDPDAGINPAPGLVGLSVKGWGGVSSTNGLAQANLDFFIVPPDSTTGQPQTMDFGNDGPLCYPANASQFSMFAVQLGGGQPNIRALVTVYGHEELF